MNLDSKNVIIREVWSSNICEELALMRTVIPNCSFASFNTEFPGTIFTPRIDKAFYSNLSPSTNYNFLKANVDVMNIIQLGLTLCDSNGNLPQFGTQNGHVWQFNFREFDVERDHHNPESIQLLKKQGIDFVKTKKEGITSCLFRWFLVKSGLMFNPHITWVTFQGSYDFGLLIKLLSKKQLPHDVLLFKNMVTQYFGAKIYDIKHIIKFCNGLYGGLERVAKTLNVDRVVGKHHQAGSDSLLTLQTFMNLKNIYFSGNSKIETFQGIIYGLEVDTTTPIN